MKEKLTTCTNHKFVLRKEHMIYAYKEIKPLSVFFSLLSFLLMDYCLLLMIQVIIIVFDVLVVYIAISMAIYSLVVIC